MPREICREKAKENVLFTYLYRDYGNYKKYSQIVFANPDRLLGSQVIHHFEKTLVLAFPEAAESQFRAEALCLPTTYFCDGRTDDDHGWHEYDTFSETDAAPTVTEKRSIAQFLLDLSGIAKNLRAKKGRIQCP